MTGFVEEQPRFLDANRYIFLNTQQFLSSTSGLIVHPEVQKASEFHREQPLAMSEMF